MRYLLVIPSYNERENIEALLAAIDSLARPDLDILVVDDASPDGTASLVKAGQARYPRLFILERAGKMGLGAAYRDGFLWGLARAYDVLIEMDADFSHHPSYLPLIMEKVKDKDFVIGSRYVPGGAVPDWSWQRKAISALGSLYARLILGAPIRDFTGGFNAWQAPLIKTIGLESLSANGYSFQIELKYRAWLAQGKFLEVPIIFKDRTQGKSKISSGIIREALWRIPYLRFKFGAARLKEFIKFALVGLTGVVVDFGFLFLFKNVFQITLLVANGLSFTLAVINNYLGNRFWTFPRYARGRYEQLGKFFLVSLIGLGLNTALMAILVAGGLWYVYAKLIITALVLVWNYLANKAWTFRALKPKKI